MANVNTRTTSNHSEHSLTFIIIGTEKPEIAKRWRAFFASGEPVKELKGRYTYLEPFGAGLDGKRASVEEDAFLISPERFALMLHNGLLEEQESVLVLGPKAESAGFRPATLHFLKPGSLPQYLGEWKPLVFAFDELEETRYSNRDHRALADEKAEALRALDAWTYDPSTDTYFVCER